MSKRVYITGIGIVCAIGNNVHETLQSLLTEKSGIGEITLFPTIHKGVIPLAEVKLSNKQLQTELGFHGAKNFTRTALLGMKAAREAVESASITDIKSSKTGLVSATTVGGMDRSENFYSCFLKNPKKGRLVDVINHDCSDSTERIAGFLKIKDFVTTISTACSSSVNALMFGSSLIKAGQLDRVIVGGNDAVTRFTLNGFNTLMILDKTGCHPFDENRAGLTLGEGAAFLVLESEDIVAREKKRVLAEVSGYGNANDAYHQTASSPEGKGAYLAMAKAIEMSGLNPADIDYINGHGTGTENNDLSEGIAMERIFGNFVPPFSSTKGYTGHALGAAGAIEAVISVLAIQNRVIFPNLNFSTPMKELKIRPVTVLRTHCEINHVLSNSFGFGGNNSAVILSKV
ncbi:MAG: beta-ketoacyl-[acyl-carrier-protein] synthase family protein [Bacteroidales bacterium]|jgi:3-oxoacyl-[acyl-carrier-protein] synthase-1|nr:beta-ketoacyl-[acyl-carrier-protein] synthase family protein [Bacteroidales bacterium]